VSVNIADHSAYAASESVDSRSVTSKGLLAHAGCIFGRRARSEAIRTRRLSLKLTREHPDATPERVPLLEA
jgi:hypothetical protein